MFKINGKLTHRSGSLLPAPNANPTYAQLYIYDPADALNYRMAHQANSTLHCETMQQLQDMLWHKHPGVQLYQQAHEQTCNMGPDEVCNIALHFDKSCDHLRYNLPTAASNEIAVILPSRKVGEKSTVKFFHNLLTSFDQIPFASHLSRIPSSMCFYSVIWDYFIYDIFSVFGGLGMNQ